MWTAKTDTFEDADVICLFVAGTDEYSSVFERCVFKRKCISVDGENVAKTIVWTDAFFVKMEPNENENALREDGA